MKQTFGKVAKALSLLPNLMAIIAALCMIAIMVVTLIDVIGRYVFNSPLKGGVELSELLMVALVFLSLAYTQKIKANIRIDIISGPPKLVAALNTLTYLISSGLIGYLAWISANVAYDSWLIGEFSFGLIPFPIWPSKILVALGWMILAPIFLVDVGREMAILLGKRSIDQGALDSTLDRGI